MIYISNGGQDNLDQFLLAKERLINILEEFKSVGIIISFSECPIKGLEGKTFMKVFHLENLYIKIFLGMDKLDVTEKYINSGSDFINLDAEDDVIRALIMKHIEHGRYGYAIEKRVQKVLENLNNYQKGFSCSILPQSVVDDSKGRDFVIELDYLALGYRIWGRIPLQIKSNEYHQKKHIEKYPSVPSVVIDINDSDEIILKKIIQVVEGYFEGKILHI
ncbi:MAG: hypothetical protein WC795_00410 [Candidatus Paceibacterota bacterium]|jgi:hypothetical protein